MYCNISLSSILCKVRHLTPTDIRRNAILLGKVSVFFLCIITLFAAGCASSHPQQKKKYRIGVSQCSSDDWRHKMNEEIEREIMFNDNAEVEIRSAEDDNARQIADIQYFIDNDFDIIIAAPNEARAITPIIKKAFDKGIPVITFDRDIIGDSYTSHIEVDNTGLGASAAKYALATIPGTLKVLEIQGAPNMTPTFRRHDGFSQTMADNPRAHVIASEYGNWNADRAAAITDSILRIHPDINLVYAHNDRMAIAAAEAAKRRGLKNIHFIGIDGTPHIGIKAVKDGVIDATFLYPTDGQVLVKTALDILEGRPYQRIKYLDPLSAVDTTNADILLRQNDLLVNETRNISLLQSKLDAYWDKHAAQTSLLYACIALVVLLCGVAILIFRMYWQHKKHKDTLQHQNTMLEHERDKQQVLYQRLEEATQSKLSFFTNVSHDLRTPLTLISEPLAQLQHTSDLSPEQRNTLLSLANKNAKILRRLIDQILDFRKYENGRLSFYPSPIDLPPLIREWCESFLTLARKRHIRLNIEIPEDMHCYVSVDIDKMERVCFNLISNAFKYTPDNGTITVSADSSDTSFILRVQDTGIGIPTDEIAHIFDRFYQVDKLQPNGSGIGLALTKAFVELHEGTISAESNGHCGSLFTVSLPISQSASAAKNAAVTPSDATDGLTSEAVADPASHSVAPLPSAVADELASVETSDVALDPDRPTLLVIDDNEDIRRLITTLLSDQYNIITASSGRNGIRKATKYIPDIIICDIMMPEMDGMECCTLIKQEISTSHIPVLMLTACALDAQKAEGYRSGADGYLSKPFDAEVLRSMCSSLILNRKRIHDLYRDQSAPNAPIHHEAAPLPSSSEQDIPGDMDNEFYRKFISLVKEQLSNSELSVDWLAGEMNLSKSQFTRKIKALTNFTPVEIIRMMRLKEARHLLTTTELPVSQIAYEVGFSLPAYFSKCYKDAYGESPSDLRSRLGH